MKLDKDTEIKIRYSTAYDEWVASVTSENYSDYYRLDENPKKALKKLLKHIKQRQYSENFTQNIKLDE